MGAGPLGHGVASAAVRPRRRHAPGHPVLAGVRGWRWFAFGEGRQLRSLWKHAEESGAPRRRRERVGNSDATGGSGAGRRGSVGLRPGERARPEGRSGGGHGSRSRCCPPGKEEGRWHQDPQRLVANRAETLLSGGGAPGRGPGPALARAWRPGPGGAAQRRLGDGQTPRGAHLARAGRAARLVHAGGGGARARSPAEGPGLRARAEPRARGKGLAVPRDCGREPEPLCAFTPQARPEAGGSWVLAPLPGCGAPTLSPPGAPLALGSGQRLSRRWREVEAGWSCRTWRLSWDWGLGRPAPSSPSPPFSTVLSERLHPEKTPKDQICHIPQLKFAYTIIFKRS